VILGIEREERPGFRSTWAATGSSLALAVLLLACSPDSDSNGPTAVSTRSNAGNVGYFALIVDSLIDLGMLPGGTGSEANDVNSAGVVAGTTSLSGGSRATLWSRPAPPQDLGTLPSQSSSEAEGISDGNVVIGVSSSPGETAFQWTASAGMAPLFKQVWVPADNSYWQGKSAATGISPNGLVTGHVHGMTLVGEMIIPFLYTPGTRKPAIGLLSRGCTGWGHAVNDAGQVVAQIQCPGVSAAVWGQNGWNVVPNMHSDKLGISATGKVVGQEPTSWRAVRWSPSSGTSYLTPLAAVGSSNATDLNSYGYAVGYTAFGVDGYTRHAWIEGGGLAATDLPALNAKCGGFQYDVANAINDSKVIVGSSRGCDGKDHAVMWKVRIVFVPQTPGPPPSP
jgi:hypothetical protein